MDIILKLKKEDIVTRLYGNNVGIEAKGATIILDYDAAEELANDIARIISDDTNGEERRKVCYR